MSALRSPQQDGKRRLIKAAIRDESHGLVLWALGVLLGAVVAFSDVMAAVSTATTAASNVLAGEVGIQNWQELRDFVQRAFDYLPVGLSSADIRNHNP